MREREELRHVKIVTTNHMVVKALVGDSGDHALNSCFA